MSEFWREMLTVKNVLTTFISGYLGHQFRLLAASKLGYGHDPNIGLKWREKFAWTVSLISLAFVMSDEENRKNPFNIPMRIVTFSLILHAIKCLKLFRNPGEDIEVILDSKQHIGVGLAATYFHGFLQRAIKGLPDEDVDRLLRNHSQEKGIESLLNAYKRRESLPADGDWFCSKLLILFPFSLEKPETDQPRGSILDLWRKEKDNDENFGLVFQRIEHKYRNREGQIRNVTLHVFKFKEELHSGRWCNNYIAVAENRPLNALYNMLDETIMEFSEFEFEIQFHVYLNSLTQLLAGDKACAGKYQILDYKDGKGCNFSKTIIAAIQRIKREKKHGFVGTSRANPSRA